MRKRRFKKNLNLNAIIMLSIMLIIGFTVYKLNFDIIENNKIIDRKNFILFILTKNLIAKELFRKENDLIGVKYRLDIRNLKIFINKIKEKPVALICYKNECYFLGQHSYIFEKDNSFSKNLLVIQSPYPIYKNSYLKPELTNALSIVFEYSNLKLLPLKGIEILSNFDLIVKTKNFSFLIDPYKNINAQLNKLSFFLENYKNTDYSLIDLRIPQKIFFK